MSGSISGGVGRCSTDSFSLSRLKQRNTGMVGTATTTQCQNRNPCSFTNDSPLTPHRMETPSADDHMTPFTPTTHSILLPISSQPTHSTRPHPPPSPDHQTTTIHHHLTQLANVSNKRSAAGANLVLPDDGWLNQDHTLSLFHKETATFNLNEPSIPIWTPIN